MTTRVADMTVEELRTTIRDVVREVLEEEEIQEDFAAELEDRAKSNYHHNHGTTKPVEILKKMIESSSEPEEVVFDPYAGNMGVGGVYCARSTVFVERAGRRTFRGGEGKTRGRMNWTSKDSLITNGRSPCL